MNKTKKRIITLLLSIGLITTSLSTVFASVILFSDAEVPRNQGMQYLTTLKKDTRTNYGTAFIGGLTADAITFSVRGLNDDFGPGTVCNGTGYWRVAYKTYYDAGKSMQARFRNHNWTNATRRVTGNFDYK